MSYGKLTTEERRVVRLVALGATDRRIAQELKLTKGQVVMVLYRLRLKIGPLSRPELTALAFIGGLVAERDFPTLQKEKWRICADH
jgi:DNA-binding CsgD family transcriptional regulator